jgi:hypothetical protein
MPRHTGVMTIDVQNAFCRPQSAFVRQFGQDVAHFFGSIQHHNKSGEKTFEVCRIDRCVSQETEHKWFHAATIIPECSKEENFRLSKKQTMFVNWKSSRHFCERERERVDKGMRFLIVTGCTTTCCVRKSAETIARDFPTLRVLVDLSSCAIRTDNLRRRCGPCMEFYMDATVPRRPCVCQTGNSNTFTSPLDRTVQDLRNAGAVVDPFFNWGP